MFPGCLQDFSRMFSGCSDGSYWPGGIWWSFQMKVWTLKIQRNPMIPNYLMIPAAAIWWSPGIRWSPAIRWSIRSMDFDNRKVYGDTSITDGLVYIQLLIITITNPLKWTDWGKWDTAHCFLDMCACACTNLITFTNNTIDDSHRSFFQLSSLFLPLTHFRCKRT